MYRFHVVDSHERPPSHAAEGVVWGDGSVTTYWQNGGRSHAESMDILETALARNGYVVSWVDRDPRELTLREVLDRLARLR